MVLQQIKMLLLSIVAVLRRALCCFSRRRKQIPSEAQEDLQSISIVDNDYNVSKRPSTASERDWNSWDDSPRTVEEHIEQYRQRLGKPSTPQKEEPEPNFFSELAPVIKPQRKYYLEDNAQEKADFSRLEATFDVPIPVNADLEDWVDGDVGGWEELSADKTKELIREKRREMRNQRQKLKEKSHGIDYQRQGIRYNPSPTGIIGQT